MRRKVLNDQNEGPQLKTELATNNELVQNKPESSGKKTVMVPSIINEQELLRSLHHAAIITSRDVCEETRNKLLMPIEFEPEVVARVTAVLFDTFTQTWIPDLYAFSDHAKRERIGVEDVKLLMRKNWKLCQTIEASCGINSEITRKNSGRQLKRKNGKIEPTTSKIHDNVDEPIIDDVLKTDNPIVHVTTPVSTSKLAGRLLNKAGVTPKPPIAHSTPMRATPMGGRKLPAQRMPSPIIELYEGTNDSEVLGWNQEQNIKSFEEQCANSLCNDVEMYGDLFDEASTSPNKALQEVVADSFANKKRNSTVLFSEDCNETMVGEETILNALGYGDNLGEGPNANFKNTPSYAKLSNNQELLQPQEKNDSIDSFDEDILIVHAPTPKPPPEKRFAKQLDDLFDDEFELVEDIQTKLPHSTPRQVTNPFKKNNNLLTNDASNAKQIVPNTDLSKCIPTTIKVDEKEYDSFDDDLDFIPAGKKDSVSKESSFASSREKSKNQSPKDSKENGNKNMAYEQTANMNGQSKGRLYDSFFDDDFSDFGLHKVAPTQKKPNASTSKIQGISDFSNISKNLSRRSKLGENFSAFDFFDDDV